MVAVNCKKESYDIYIGRPSIWGNPFVMNREDERDYVVTKYMLWLNTQPDLLETLPKLKGKKLGCYCAPKACHGDILTKLSESKWIQNWFSNMLPFDTPLEHEGIIYKTVENFYQAMKLSDKKCQIDISQMPPFHAKQRIRDKKDFPWKKNWNDKLALEVMTTGIAHKFAKGTSWAKLLEMTEDWEIIEWSNWGDSTWGKTIQNRKGDNLLGKILMERRRINNAIH
jgi:ribA/ribD-fused uncharacterized protein